MSQVRFLGVVIVFSKVGNGQTLNASNISYLFSTIAINSQQNQSENQLKSSKE